MKAVIPIAAAGACTYLQAEDEPAFPPLYSVTLCKVHEKRRSKEYSTRSVAFPELSADMIVFAVETDTDNQHTRTRGCGLRPP